MCAKIEISYLHTWMNLSYGDQVFSLLCRLMLMVAREVDAVCNVLGT